jgi:hypothetical protein
VQTPLPDGIKQMFIDNLSRICTRTEDELEAVEELVRLLEDEDTEEAIVSQPQLDSFALRDGLRDVQFSLEKHVPIHVILYNALPSEILMRSHYAETLQVRDVVRVRD